MMSFLFFIAITLVTVAQAALRPLIPSGFLSQAWPALWLLLPTIERGSTGRAILFTGMTGFILEIFSLAPAGSLIVLLLLVALSFRFALHHLIDPSGVMLGVWSVALLSTWLILRSLVMADFSALPALLLVNSVGLVGVRIIRDYIYGRRAAQSILHR